MARKMKDSGVEWIGEIPEEWEVTKNKFCVSINNGKEVTSTEGIIPVYGTGGVFKYTNDYLYEGESVLLGRKGSIDKPLYVNDKFWTIDTAFYTKIKENTNVKYFYYLAYCFDYKYYQTGSAVPSMTQSDLGNISIPRIDLKEQEKIAQFLDVKCSEIDSAIQNAKESIEEYEKYKQIISAEYVLGKNKNSQKKKSNIDWIGDIPEQWSLKPFKYVMNERNEKNLPEKTNERLALSIDKGITTYAEKTTNLDRFKDDVTKYKLAHIGDLVFNSMNMIVGAIGYSRYFGCVSPVYYTFYDNQKDHITSRYYEYLFRSKVMRKVLFSLGKGIMAIDRGDDKINTCRLKVSRDDLRNMIVPVPSETEQRQIVESLDEKCTEIDNIIQQKEVLIKELEQYKKSLIYEYVTGKKEVS